MKNLYQRLFQNNIWGIFWSTARRKTPYQGDVNTEWGADLGCRDHAEQGHPSSHSVLTASFTEMIRSCRRLSSRSTETQLVSGAVQSCLQTGPIPEPCSFLVPQGLAGRKPLLVLERISLNHTPYRTIIKGSLKHFNLLIKENSCFVFFVFSAPDNYLISKLMK